jgi:hypothetical protein
MEFARETGDCSLAQTNDLPSKSGGVAVARNPTKTRWGNDIIPSLRLQQHLVQNLDLDLDPLHPPGQLVLHRRRHQSFE